MRRARRGHYGTSLAPLLAVLLGFTAMVVDAVGAIGADGEARAVAQVAAHAALIELRRSAGDPAAASAEVEQVLARNTVAREAPTLASLTVGAWDDRADAPAFDGSGPANAVEVVVRSEPARAWFAPVLGVSTGPVLARAVAASRGLDLVLAVDLDPAWTEGDLLAVRRGLGGLLARLAATAGPGDRVALVGFHSRYAWVLSPLASTAGSAGIVADLGPGSRAGLNLAPEDGVDCAPHAGADEDDFALGTVGGCYPSMPRVYADEDGTDLGVALEAAAAILAGASDPSAARAVLVVGRDGVASVGPSAGTTRAAQGYVEARFVERASSAGRAEPDLLDDAEAAAGTLWDDLGAHVWVVTAGPAPELDGVPRGDGAHFAELDAAAVEARLPELVSALPLGVVE